MPLIIFERDIVEMPRRGDVTMSDYGSSLEGVYRELASGSGESLRRGNFWIEEPSQHDRVRSLKVGAGVLRHKGYHEKPRVWPS